MIRLTDEQWERIRDHFPEENIADGRPGRKPTPTRCVLEAILWVLNTGAQWHMLPQSYPNYKTVHRRFQTWCRDEVLRRVLTDVAMAIVDRHGLPLKARVVPSTLPQREIAWTARWAPFGPRGCERMGRLWRQTSFARRGVGQFDQSPVEAPTAALYQHFGRCSRPKTGDASSSRSVLAALSHW